MLNPAPITDAIAGVLLSIPELNAAMNGRIMAFHYRLGQENRLAEAVYKMPAPSMLIVWEGTRGGNFDGQAIWKHRLLGERDYRIGSADRGRHHQADQLGLLPENGLRFRRRLPVL